MKPWERAVGNIRLLGPDIPSFREDVKLVTHHIEYLEQLLRRCQPLVNLEAGLANSGHGNVIGNPAKALRREMEAVL